MCGIVGVITKGSLKREHMAYLQQSLYAGALRGFDSTGLMGVMEDGTSNMWKKAIASSDFLQLKMTENYLGEFNNYQSFIGHNRASTRGKTIDRNAHPFKCGNITMVHNGTLHSLFDLPRGNSFNVDSEALANAIDELGIEEAVSKAQGAFAVVYHNAIDNTINIIRNNKREINFCKVKNEDTILIASEIEMLKWIAGRTKHEIEFPILHPNPGDLITFGLNDMDVSKYKLRQLELYKPPTIYNGTSRSGQGTYNNVTEPNQTSEKRRERQGVLLKTMGYEVGEQIKFTPYSYDAYNPTTNNGKIMGCTDADPYDTVVCHNVKETDFHSGSTYLGEIMSAIKIQNKQGVYTDIQLLLQPDSLVLLKTHEEIQQKKVTEAKKKEEDKRSKSKNTSESKPLGLYVKGPGNCSIDRKTWTSLTRDGCSQCLCNLDIHDSENIHWVDSRSPMCFDCAMKWEDFATGKNSGLPFN